MVSLNDIYETKSILYSEKDMSGLIEILSKQNIQANDNYDRTIMINCEEDHDIHKSMNKAIKKWMKGHKLTCPTYYLYNVLPVTQNEFIIRI